MLEKATGILFLISVRYKGEGSGGNEVLVKIIPELLLLNCRKPVRCFPHLKTEKLCFKFNTGQMKLCFCYVLIHILFFYLDTFGIINRDHWVSGYMQERWITGLNKSLLYELSVVTRGLLALVDLLVFVSSLWNIEPLISNSVAPFFHPSLLSTTLLYPPKKGKPAWYYLYGNAFILRVFI